MNKKIKIFLVIVSFLIFIFGGWFLFDNNKQVIKQRVETVDYLQEIPCEERGDLYKKEREVLYPKLQLAITFEECKNVVKQLITLGPLDCRMVPNAVIGSSGPFEGCSCTNMYSYKELMSECLSSIALKNNNFNLCLDNKQRICQEEKKLGSSQKTESCEYNFENDCLLNYLSKASKNNSLPDCESFPSDVLKYFCLNRIAIIKNDWQTCLKIDKQVYQNNCIYYQALKNHDNSLCYKIKNINDYKDEVKDCKEKVDIFGDPGNKPNNSDSMFEYAVLNNKPSLCPSHGEWQQSHGDYCKMLTR
jgi:hypothetical protein